MIVPLWVLVFLCSQIQRFKFVSSGFTTKGSQVFAGGHTLFCCCRNQFCWWRDIGRTFCSEKCSRWHHTLLQCTTAGCSHCNDNLFSVIWWSTNEANSCLWVTSQNKRNCWILIQFRAVEAENNQSFVLPKLHCVWPEKYHSIKKSCAASCEEFHWRKCMLSI